MHFYVPFHFFKVPLDFASHPKAAFFKAKAHRGTPKRRKCVSSFFSNRMAFFHALLRAICFFKVPLDFPSLSKAAFFKAKAHRGTPKGLKMSLLFFCNQMAFFRPSLRAILFFQSPFSFCIRSKRSILQV